MTSILLVILMGLPATALGLSVECKPVLSDSTQDEDDFRQIECETSTCYDTWVVQYEKRHLQVAEQWTPVYASRNNTHHSLNTGTEYSLKNRTNYVTFPTKSLLYIHPLRHEDHGEWRCVVYDIGNVPYESEGIDIHIHELAQVLYPQQSIIVTTGTDLTFTLNCTGSGITPSIGWTRNGKRILSNDTRFATERVCNATICEGSLRLKPVEKAVACANKNGYAGVYTCVISLEPPYQSTQISPNMNVEVPMNHCNDDFIGTTVGIIVLSVMCTVLVTFIIAVLVFLTRKKYCKGHSAQDPIDERIPLLEKIDVNSKYHKLQITIAIDLGTTYSGYAYTCKHQDKIWVNKTWVDNDGNQVYKAPTCVLTKGDYDEFVAFGYEAQSLFYNGDDSAYDSDNDEQKDHQRKTHTLHFYDEFKMVLHSNKEIGKHITVTSNDGHECEAAKIFVMALEYLSNHILDYLRKLDTKYRTLKHDDIKWIIAVPIIWTDGAKQFMRQCAVKAGIISNPDSDRLLIALEPEAASLYCKTLEQGESINDPSVVKRIPRNSHYMVVDCGGGTVDITVHHYKQDGEICELYSAAGGNFGGGNINRNFVKKLAEVLGKEVMDQFRQKYHSAYLDLTNKFEKDKKLITLDSPNAKYVLWCPLILDKLCQQVHGKGVDIRVQSSYAQHRVAFSEGKLKFDYEVLKDMFKPSIEEIKTLIFGLVAKDELKHLKYIFLIGGFSECSFLHNEVKKQFTEGVFKDRNIHVISAQKETSFAVVKGAVLFGNNPQVIASRRAQRHYCTNQAHQIESIDHDKLVRPTIISQNEEIFFDDVRRIVFSPLSEGTTFKLYHYKDENPAELQKGENEIKIDLSNLIIDSEKDPKISIYFYFGGTELYVTARNNSNPGGTFIKQTINCMQH